MSETRSEPERPSTSKAVTEESEAQVVFTGENVLILLRQATDLAGGNSRYAVEITQRMSDELWVAQKRVEELQARIAELEAEVELYRDKSDRAEAWLGKISSEIQERVLAGSNN
jgi:cell division protein FtsB